ncbi:hypothetical protein NQ318_009293 [Aromia moschata]|uniref:Uncharacterized protein n=1 Tax=Aromia moschata TaxID=1265417 RepID=A0AAV8YKB0_9CUCU|nr:hypothetical protein NQ318_009293 [Aromia moschata]
MQGLYVYKTYPDIHCFIENTMLGYLQNQSQLRDLDLGFGLEKIYSGFWLKSCLPTIFPPLTVASASHVARSALSSTSLPTPTPVYDV